MSNQLESHSSSEESAFDLSTDPEITTSGLLPRKQELHKNLLKHYKMYCLTLEKMKAKLFPH